MAAEPGPRLLSIGYDALDTGTQNAVGDLLTCFDPDLVYVSRNGRDMRTVSHIERAFDGPVLVAGRGADPVQSVELGGVSIVAVDSLASLKSALESIGKWVDPDADFLLCDEIRPTTDAVSLTATLHERGLLEAIQEHTSGETTFLTGALEASYDHRWDGSSNSTREPVPIRGVAPIRRAGESALPCLVLSPTGDVAVKSVPAGKFGLQAIAGVGPTKRERLRERGFESRTDVAESSVHELLTVPGVGETTAERMQQSARAIVDGSVVRTSRTSVPAREGPRLFLDIETDGLNPTIIWLIGVLDPATGTYTDFVETEPSPSRAGRVTREFVSWLAAEYDTVSLMTWNGHEFDFKYLRQFVTQYAGAYTDYWTDSVREYDLYAWATQHAVLPGRTNRLETVARALAIERSSRGAGLDGASLARAIRRRMYTPDRAGSIDWDRARAYCEGDVRDLAAVYDAIASTPPRKDESDAKSASTTQAGLGEFQS